MAALRYSEKKVVKSRPDQQKIRLRLKVGSQQETFS